MTAQIWATVFNFFNVIFTFTFVISATKYQIPRFSPNVEFMNLNFKGNSYDGIIWNKLIRHIQTPYVFLGLDILQFDESINFERMVSPPVARLFVDIFYGKGYFFFIQSATQFTMTKTAEIIVL